MARIAKIALGPAEENPTKADFPASEPVTRAISAPFARPFIRSRFGAAQAQIAVLRSRARLDGKRLKT
jgi:hypothetical protein